uniref:Uncharacterized LOC100180197 n=1 Tax=Ciona intestinalis TaxID=7719 RepID=F6RQC5_CIOIN|nr:uncharacterized protein LOC100180197 isoform X1 [Ciona intestinalis]XP_026695529.1 uncharacterized protein LOC100180197 isoform X1 [Ciona intestinalis]|eukprot:XP_026695528.1 uncharacterized protein LOC100180197 isoform X1 [Ciona intestinalis]
MSPKLTSYRYFLPIQTRWADNDNYGHINNSVYHYYVDTIVNNYLIWYCDITEGIGWMVETQCSYRNPLHYPQVVLGGLAITKVGTSSVHYSVGFFEPLFKYSEIIEGGDPLLELKIGSQGILVSPSHPDKYDDIGKYYRTEASVVGSPVHVFVDKQTNRPVNLLNQKFRENLEKLTTFETKL